LASLALHALVALWLTFREPQHVVPEHLARPIEIDMIELPEARPPASPPPAAAPKAPRSAEKKKAIAEAAPAPASPSPQPAAPKAKGGASAAAPDAPRSVTLVPSSEFAIAAGTNGIEPEGPRGHTVVNSPEEQPDPIAMREYTSEKLGRRTGAMVSGMVADTQARTGLVDPYFMGARAALEGELSNGDVPLPKEHSLPREALKGFLQNQENFGRTGNPFAAGAEPKWNDFSMARNETAGMAMQARDPNWAGVNRQAEQSMAAQQATNQMLDHAFVEAIIELVQEPGGGIADAHVVKSSGYRAFDEYVLHRARKVFLTLDDPPEQGHGISSQGWRTLWKFSYFPMSISEMRGQRVRVQLLRVEKGQGSGNPLDHGPP
jgi:hypothetical protein